MNLSTPFLKTFKPQHYAGTPKSDDDDDLNNMHAKGWWWWWLEQHLHLYSPTDSSDRQKLNMGANNCERSDMAQNWFYCF